MTTKGLYTAAALFVAAANAQNSPAICHLKPAVQNPGVDYSPLASPLEISAGKRIYLEAKDKKYSGLRPASLVALPQGWTLARKPHGHNTENYLIVSPSGTAFDFNYESFGDNYSPARFLEIKKELLKVKNHVAIGDKIAQWEVSWDKGHPTYGIWSFNAGRTVAVYVTCEKAGVDTLPEARSLATALVTSFKVVDP